MSHILLRGWALLSASSGCCSILPCSAGCFSSVCWYSALILCILLLAQIQLYPLAFFPKPTAISLWKTCFCRAGIPVLFLWCGGQEEFRCFCTICFLAFSALSFEKGGRGNTASNFRSTGWEEVVCLCIGGTELACWRHLFL